jgi:hypothetical protein
VRFCAIVLILASVGPVCAQTGQEGPRAGWPCVPGRAVDPSYIDVSESTGGQLVLFQKGEVGQSGPVMSASFTHPATVLRMVGNFNGSRDIEFPVDSTIESLLLLVSVQCRNRILVFRPSGVEVTDRNSALSVNLASSSIVRIDRPEPGKWQVRLQGNGLFVVSVLAKTDISLGAVSFSPEPASAQPDQPPSWKSHPNSGAPHALELRLSGQVSRLAARVVDASGAPVADLKTPEKTAEGAYRTVLDSLTGRYRIVVTGEDGNAWPFQRTHPILFRTQPLQLAPAP